MGLRLFYGGMSWAIYCPPEEERGMSEQFWLVLWAAKAGANSQTDHPGRVTGAARWKFGTHIEEALLPQACA